MMAVLIETLWNVKIDSRIGANALVRVLIETLWNVKTTGDAYWYPHVLY